MVNSYKLLLIIQGGAYKDSIEGILVYLYSHDFVLHFFVYKVLSEDLKNVLKS